VSENLSFAEALDRILGPERAERFEHINDFIANKEHAMFDEQWKKEMMQFKKADLVDMLAGTKRLMLTDHAFLNWDRIRGMIECENKIQLQKWGLQSHTAFEWLGYLAEEVGETGGAIGKWMDGAPPFNVVQEAVQAATLAAKIAEMFLATNPDRPQARCPKCRTWQWDDDGFGVLMCAKCGYCTHPAATGNICDWCGKKMS